MCWTQLPYSRLLLEWYSWCVLSSHFLRWMHQHGTWWIRALMDTSPRPSMQLEVHSLDSIPLFNVCAGCGLQRWAFCPLLGVIQPARKDNLWPLFFCLRPVSSARGQAQPSVCQACVKIFWPAVNLKLKASSGMLPIVGIHQKFELHGSSRSTLLLLPEASFWEAWSLVVLFDDIISKNDSEAIWFWIRITQPLAFGVRPQGPAGQALVQQDLPVQ